MWLMELLCGVLLLEMAESLRGSRTGEGVFHRDKQEVEEQVSVSDTRSGGSGLGWGVRGKAASRKQDCSCQKMEQAAPPAEQQRLPPLSNAPGLRMHRRVSHFLPVALIKNLMITQKI